MQSINAWFATERAAQVQVVAKETRKEREQRLAEETEMKRKIIHEIMTGRKRRNIIRKNWMVCAAPCCVVFCAALTPFCVCVIRRCA
jgi:hypothetical protein